MRVRLRNLCLCLSVCVGISLWLSNSSVWAQQVTPSYDPLEVPADFDSAPYDGVVADQQRDREIPIRVYWPESDAPAPVILFSHGLGGSREGNPYLGNHWSARGYVVVFLQHAGSDSAVWKNSRVGQRMQAMQAAANIQNTLARFQDVPAVLDQLDRWNRSPESPFSGRLNMQQIGMSGHSYGAVTTQAVSGQSFGQAQTRFTDERIKAAIIMSPSAPRNRITPEQAFGSVKVPWLLMTGTKDLSSIGNADLESRLAVYPALPSGEKYEIVFHNGAHEVFSDRDLPGTKQPRNPNHHRVILATSAAFWDAYLKQDAAAKRWLAGSEPETLMETQDRWQTK